MFSFYSKLDPQEKDVKIVRSVKKIQLKSLLKFASEFRITPNIIDQDEFIVLYNYLLKEQSEKGKESILALDYEDFLECLIRIAIYSKRKLDDKPNKQKIAATKIYDLQGVKADVIEALFKHMNISEEDTKEKIIQMVTSIRNEGFKGSISEDKNDVKQEDVKQEVEPKENPEQKKEKEQEVIAPGGEKEKWDVK